MGFSFTLTFIRFWNFANQVYVNYILPCPWLAFPWSPMMLDISSCINYQYVFPLLPLFFWIVYTLLHDFLSCLESARYAEVSNIIAIIHINHQLSRLMFHFVHDILCKLTTRLELIHQVLFKNSLNHSN